MYGGRKCSAKLHVWSCQAHMRYKVACMELSGTCTHALIAALRLYDTMPKEGAGRRG